MKPEQITCADGEQPGGRVTVLEAPYREYSRVKATVDSRKEGATAPALRVAITTGKEFHTRHKDLEDRVHEVVRANLRARQHGTESKPTALPPAELKKN